MSGLLGEKEQFAEMRKKWVNRLTGNLCSKSVEESVLVEYKKMVAGYEKEAEESRRFLTTDSSSMLFTDLALSIENSIANDGNSTNAAASMPYNTAIFRIFTMARSWATKASKYYHDVSLQSDILYAMEWMYAHCYNEALDNQKMFGNWYYWWISIPQNLAGTVIMMHDVMPSALLEKEAATLARFNEEPTYTYKVKGDAGKLAMTSGNLADTSLVCVLRGVAFDEPWSMRKGLEQFGELARFVPSGEGIYEDGSFIQHTNLAYTGGYGATLLNGIEKLIYIVAGTSWEIEKSKLEVVYEWIWQGIRPLFANGAMFDMVFGRGVARPSSKDVLTGRSILGAVVLLAESAQKDTKLQIQSFAKEQLEKAIEYCGKENYFSGMSPAAMMASVGILADDSILAEANTGYAKVYGCMDKAVAHANKFSFGISYASQRTGRFEFGNEENKLGWHQGDGACYLYNGDFSQYADAYWPTVDPDRLAGITTDHSTWPLTNWGNYTGTGNFNGGAILGQLMAVAMEYKNYEKASNPELTARKSWFVFDEEVVALGAGISGIKENLPAETIVENKKINENNVLVVNGALQSLPTGETYRAQNVCWAWLSGNAKEDMVGYYFPQKSTLDIMRESRTSSWFAINGAKGTSAAPITKEYVSLAIPHGKKKETVAKSFEKAKYAYVLLPSKSQEEVAAYSQDPAVEIMCNSTHVQAVCNRSAGVLSCIFLGGAKAVRVGEVEAQTGAIIVKEDKENHRMTIGISDISQEKEYLKFRVYGVGLRVLHAEHGVTAENDSQGIIVTVNTRKAKGKTFTMKMCYEKLFIQ